MRRIKFKNLITKINFSLLILIIYLKNKITIDQKSRRLREDFEYYFSISTDHFEFIGKFLQLQKNKENKELLKNYHRRKEFEILDLKARCQFLHDKNKKYRDYIDDASNIKISSTMWWLTDPHRNLQVCLGPKSGSSHYQMLYQAFNKRDLRYIFAGDAKIKKEIRSDLDRYVNKRDYDSVEDQDHLEKPFKYEDNTLGKINLSGTLQSSSDYKLNFMLVRHPFSRLYSTYRDKFRTPIKNRLFQKIENHIFENFMSKDDKFLLTTSQFDDYERGYNQFTEDFTDTPAESDDVVKLDSGNYYRISFEAFLNYIINTNESDLEIHLNSMTSICQICKLNYDFILKQEDLSLDMVYSILKIVNYQHNSKSKADWRFFKKIYQVVRHISVYNSKNFLDIDEKDKKSKQNLINFSIFNHYSDYLKEVRKKAEVAAFREVFENNQTIRNALYERFEADIILLDYSLKDYF